MPETGRWFACVERGGKIVRKAANIHKIYGRRAVSEVAGLAKRIAKLEKLVAALRKINEHCTCCTCRKYTKPIPLKEN